MEQEGLVNGGREEEGEEDNFEDMEEVILPVGEFMM